MEELVGLCLRAKATARIRQPGTSHIARSSGAAAGRVSNDEAFPAVCDSHVQQSVPAVRGWMANHAGLLALRALPAWTASTATSQYHLLGAAGW